MSDNIFYGWDFLVACWAREKWSFNYFQVFCGIVFSFHLRMLLAKMLALVISIMPISISWAGVVGAPEALAIVEYSLMARKIVASGLGLL